MPVPLVEIEAWDDSIDGPIPGEIGDAILIQDALKALGGRTRYVRGAFRVQAVATAFQEDDDENNQVNQTIAVATYTDLTGMTVTINGLKTNDVALALWNGNLSPTTGDAGYARLLFDGSLMTGSQQRYSLDATGVFTSPITLLGYAVVASDGNKICKVQARNLAGTNNHQWRGAARLVVAVFRPTP